jgi:transcriptional regulator with XRE-family HTH domain
MGSELGDFLRTRRGQLAPRQVGLRAAGRRRTPGLRREEVASIAGVSIDYLVRLEQGREKNPSIGVLAALAGALVLSEEEHRHLHTLAALAHHDDRCAPVEKPPARVAPTVHELLGHLARVPAHVVGPFGDLLAWNPVWERLAEPLGALDPRHGRNLARYVFLDPAARTATPDWPSIADRYAAMLRQAFLRWSRDDDLVRLLDDLGESAEFGCRWAAHPVVEGFRGSLRVQHPLGALHVRFETLSVAADGQRLTYWPAVDEQTGALYRRLAGDRGPVPAAPSAP